MTAPSEILDYAERVRLRLEALPWNTSGRETKMFTSRLVDGKHLWPYEIELQGYPHMAAEYQTYKTADTSLLMALRDAAHREMVSGVRVNAETWVDGLPGGLLRIYIPCGPA